MRRPLIRFGLTLAFLFNLPAVHGASLSEQRQYYDQAKAALAKGNSDVYYQYAQALADYPLEPYLAYSDLTARLKTASNEEVSRLLSAHGDLPQTNWLKLRWLRLLASRGDWQTFTRYYDPQLNFTELDCLYGQYQLSHHLEAEGEQTAERLWLVGKPQPDACDATFALWAARGKLTENKRWQRIKLAVEARQYDLAKRLSQDLSTLQQPAALLLQVAQTPQLLNNPARFQPADSAMSDVVSLGLRRLAKQDPENALSLLDSYARNMSFSSEEKVAIARQIGLSLARSFDSRALPVMSEYDPNLRDDDVSEWRARLLLRLGRWNEAYQLINRMPATLADSNRWRYWRARSFELANPNAGPEAAKLYSAVAKERDFYGFLAAEHVQAPYNLTDTPIVPKAATLAKVKRTDGIRRALEFYDRGEVVDARREWYHVSRFFSREEMAAQARMAYNMGWYFPAIRTIGLAEYWDDLEVRFPTPYRELFLSAARARDLHPSWTFAITRQESAFMTDARSGVGATGLMQLMPATAQETAKKSGIPLANQNNLLQPDVNIQLGTAYLSQLYNRFNGNRVLATAAYNAGAGRVNRWLANARQLPFDVWVESIPFDETRKYVQNVLSYAVIYGRKLNAPQSVADWHERFFDDL